MQPDAIRVEAERISQQLAGRLSLDAAMQEIQALVDYGLRPEQAAQQVVAAHRQTATPQGPKHIADLEPEQRGLELKVRILDVSARTVNVKGAPKEIFSGTCADASGSTRFTAWRDFSLSPGMSIHVKNASTRRGFRQGVDLQLGDYTQVQELDTPVESAAPVQAPSPTAQMKVSQIEDGMRGLRLMARVLQAETTTVNTQDGPREVVRGELADETGKVYFTAWEPSQLPAEFRPGSNFLFNNLTARSFRNAITVSINGDSQLDLLPANAVTPTDAAAPVAAAPKVLSIANAAQSGATATIIAPILSVHEGSGIILRCGQEGCTRPLYQGACQTHGPRDGEQDLRIRAIVDDGESVATLYASRAVAEGVLKKTLAACIPLPREDVLHELRAALECRYFALTGRIKQDDRVYIFFLEALEAIRPDHVPDSVQEILESLDGDERARAPR